MSPWRRLGAIIKRLFHGSPTTEPEPRTPTNPLRASPHPDATTLDVSIHQSAALTDANDRHPEHVVARHLRHALTTAGYNVDISFGYEPVPGDYTAADNDALSSWASRSYDADDLNLLLHAGDGGGMAYLGLKAAIAPGGNIDRLVQRHTRAPKRPEDPRFWINLRAAALHEPGHTLGGRHSDVMTDPDWGDYPANEKRPSLLFHNTASGWPESPPP